MAVFSVDSDVLISQAASIRATGDNVAQQVSSMMGQLLQLQQVWQGGAAAGFQGIVDQWRGAQQQVEASLQSISQALNAAGTTYADTEQAAASMFRGA